MTKDALNEASSSPHHLAGQLPEGLSQRRSGMGRRHLIFIFFADMKIDGGRGHLHKVKIK